MFALTKHMSFEVLESYHNHGNVVQRLSIEGVLEDALDSETALLVHVVGNLSIFVVDIARVPDAGGNVLIGHFVEDTIASEDDEVMVLGYFEAFDIRDAGNDIRVASSELNFGLGISKGS